MERYNKTVGKIKHNNGKLRYETIYYPDIKPKLTDKYIIAKRLDRLDLMAFEWYGDSTLWWVIAKANNLQGGSFRIQPGTRVRIPFPLDTADVNIQTLLKNNQF